MAAGIASPADGGVAVTPDQGGEPPYVEVQGTTEIETARSDQRRESTVTLTLVARADTLRQAEAIARVLVSTLGRRFSVTAADGDGEIQTLAATTDLYGPAVQDPPPGKRPFGLPVRFRYTLSQPADPGE